MAGSSRISACELSKTSRINLLRFIWAILSVIGDSDVSGAWGGLLNVTVSERISSSAATCSALAPANLRVLQETAIKIDVHN